MAISQVNGGVSTPQTTKNNSGSVINGGSTVVLKAVKLGYDDVGVFGTKVVEGKETAKALSAGTFSYANKKPIAKKVSTSLSGVNNDVLKSGAARPELVNSIHKIQAFRTRRQSVAFVSGNWNMFTGKFATDPVVAVDTLQQDVAANPTRDVPGSLQYMSGGKTPKQDTYKKKTN